MASAKIQKYLPQSDQRLKFKKQCLRAKNILFESEQLQIGCKIVSLYDIYSSSNYLQINLFIGNKTDKPIQSFRLDFRGSSNVEMFLQEKTRTVKERTQYKERIVVGCTNYQEQILVLMDLQSPLATLRSMALPITLFTFCIFGKGDSIPAAVHTQIDLNKLLEQKYEYIQQHQLTATSSIFKKSLQIQFDKYFAHMLKICEGVYLGTFTTKTLIDQYVLVLKVVEDRKVKIMLGGDECILFDYLFQNLRFLLQ